MTLSVKMALSICLVWSVGMTWLMRQVAPPVLAEPSPLLEGAPVASRGEPGWLAPPQDVADDRSQRTRQALAQLTFPSPVERETQAARALLPRVASVGTDDVLPAVTTAAMPTLVAEAGRMLNEAANAPAVAAGPSTPIEIVSAPAVRGAPAELVSAGADGTALAGERPASADDTQDYIVAPGDTLARICRKVWNSTDRRDVAHLLAANPQLLARPDHILVGETITIPAHRTALPVARSASSGGAQASERRPATQEMVTVAAAQTDGVRWYTIKRSDSLSSIARRLLRDESRWVEIKRLNQLADADKIYPGMQIKLPPIDPLASM